MTSESAHRYLRNLVAAVQVQDAYRQISRRIAVSERAEKERELAHLWSCLWTRDLGNGWTKNGNGARSWLNVFKGPFEFPHLYDQDASQDNNFNSKANPSQHPISE
jgi:hypothetical protein